MLLEELHAIGALEDKWKDVLMFYQDTLIESITLYKGSIATLEDLGSKMYPYLFLLCYCCLSIKVPGHCHACA